MSEAVLISVRPEWCEKIARGEKTIEVRKTRPKLETPFKCYIYCTAIKDRIKYTDEFDIPLSTGQWMGNKNVVGEFVCDYIYGFTADDDYSYGVYDIDDDLVIKTGLVNGDLWSYGKGKPLFGWRISDLKIYDQPKSLSDFRKPCVNDLYCDSCAMFREYRKSCGNATLCIIRPPQSWCYVEEVQRCED